MSRPRGNNGKLIISFLDFKINIKFLTIIFRRMVVLEPLKVTILNFPENGPIEVSVPNFPNDASKGSHTVQFDRVIYIEKKDFRKVG